MAKQQGSGGDESDERDILKEIQASGFPHEIVTGKRLERLGWHATYNPIYFEQTNREYDLHANRYWSVRVGQFSYYTNVHFFIECKKSDKPWVFFLTEVPASTSNYQLIKMVAPEYPVDQRPDFPVAQPSNVKADPSAPKAPFSTAAFALPAAVRQGHHYYATGHWARTYHEPFKGKQEKAPQIYSAVMSITQATRHYYSAAIRAQQRQQATLNLYYPLIVFSGQLYQATVDDQVDIRLEPTRHVRLLHASVDLYEVNAQPWYRTDYSMIDVVHEAYLDEFISLVQAEGQAISSHTQSMLTQGTIQGFDMTTSDRLKEFFENYKSSLQ